MVRFGDGDGLGAAGKCFPGLGHGGGSLEKEHAVIVVVLHHNAVTAGRRQRSTSSRYHDREIPNEESHLSSAGLSADPKEYRSRLDEQPDEQIDAWMVELMRDISIRHGVLDVLGELRKATGLGDAGIERIYTAGGGAPATIGRTSDGQLMVPAISLHFLVPGLRSQSEGARQQMIEFLVVGFEQLVFI